MQGIDKGSWSPKDFFFELELNDPIKPIARLNRRPPHSLQKLGIDRATHVRRPIPDLHQTQLKCVLHYYISEDNMKQIKRRPQKTLSFPEQNAIWDIILLPKVSFKLTKYFHSVLEFTWTNHYFHSMASVSWPNGWPGPAKHSTPV